MSSGFRETRTFTGLSGLAGPAIGHAAYNVRPAMCEAELTRKLLDKKAPLIEGLCSVGAAPKPIGPAMSEGAKRFNARNPFPSLPADQPFGRQ